MDENSRSRLLEALIAGEQRSAKFRALFTDSEAEVVVIRAKLRMCVRREWENVPDATNEGPDVPDTGFADGGPPLQSHGTSVAVPDPAGIADAEQVPPTPVAAALVTPVSLPVLPEAAGKPATPAAGVAPEDADDARRCKRMRSVAWPEHWVRGPYIKGARLPAGVCAGCYFVFQKWEGHRGHAGPHCFKRDAE